MHDPMEEAGAGDRPRVLLVDDSPLFLQGMATLLEAEGSLEVVGLAQDGASAIARAVELRPDAVLMDVRMPLTGGVAAAATIRNRLPDTQVILVSGLWAMNQLDEPPEGVYAVLSKNVPIKHVVATVHSAVSGAPRKGRDHRGARDAGNRLNSREVQILGMLAKGYHSGRIAAELELKQKTVRNYISVIYDKLGVHGRSRAVLYAARTGLLDDEIA